MNQLKEVCHKIAAASYEDKIVVGSHAKSCLISLIYRRLALPS